MKNKNKSPKKFVLHHTKQIKNQSVYTYYQLALYYRKDKKPFRQILENLGSLDATEIEYYKSAVGCLNQKGGYFPCKLSQVSVNESKEYLSCAVGLHFWDYWDLSSVFNPDIPQKDVPTADMAKILTTLRFVQASSKSLSTKLYKDTTLEELTGVAAEKYNRARIFRELEWIDGYREALGKHIYRQAIARELTKGKLLFYDLSSANLTGLRCVMAKWGHCKDGYNTHVVLLLVITPEGYPIYWDVLQGNMAETKTIHGLIEKIESIFGKLQSVICFDRGMVSDENLKHLQNGQIKYITALDGSQLVNFEFVVDGQLFEKVKNLDLETEKKTIKELLVSASFTYFQDNLYYKEITLTEDQKKGIEEKNGKLDLDNRRYYLAFNPELAYLAQKHRKQRVDEFKEWVGEYNQSLTKVLQNKKVELIHKAIKDERKKKKISDVPIDYSLQKITVENSNKKGVQKKLVSYKIVLGPVGQDAFNKAEKHDGIWVLVTNISKADQNNFIKDADLDNFFEAYRLKTNIEESFRILSDFVEIEPFYVYTEKHIKAHFTLCVLSYLIDITILNKIRASNQTENMGLHSIFYYLRKCKQDNIQLAKDKVIQKITDTNDIQVKILKTLDCSYLVDNQYLKKYKITGIKNRA